MNPTQLIERIRTELADFQGTLEDAQTKRTAATEAKDEQLRVADAGQASLEALKAEVDFKNSTAEKKAAEAEIAAQVAEHQVQLEVDFMISLVKGTPGTDPTVAPPASA